MSTGTYVGLRPAGLQALDLPTPPSVAEGGLDRADALGAGGGCYQLQGELASGWLIGYQGNQQRRKPLTAPLVSYQNTH